MLEVLARNWPYKLLALGIAFAIWVSVTGDKPIVEDVTLPLQLQVPDTRIVTGDLPTTVTVRGTIRLTVLSRANGTLALPGTR